MSRTVKIECGISFRLRETGATKPTPITCFVEYSLDIGECKLSKVIGRGKNCPRRFH